MQSLHNPCEDVGTATGRPSMMLRMAADAAISRGSIKAPSARQSVGFHAAISSFPVPASVLTLLSPLIRLDPARTRSCSTTAHPQTLGCWSQRPP